MNRSLPLLVAFAACALSSTSRAQDPSVRVRVNVEVREPRSVQQGQVVAESRESIVLRTVMDLRVGSSGVLGGGEVGLLFRLSPQWMVGISGAAGAELGFDETSFIAFGASIARQYGELIQLSISLGLDRFFVGDESFFGLSDAVDGWGMYAHLGPVVTMPLSSSNILFGATAGVRTAFQAPEENSPLSGSFRVFFGVDWSL